MSSHLIMHASPGLMPVRRITRSIPPSDGAESAITASTSSIGAAVTGSPSFAALLPLFSVDTCVSSALASAGIMSSSSAQVIIRLTVEILRFTVDLPSPFSISASLCISIS